MHFVLPACNNFILWHSDSFFSMFSWRIPCWSDIFNAGLLQCTIFTWRYGKDPNVSFPHHSLISNYQTTNVDYLDTALFGVTLILFLFFFLAWFYVNMFTFPCSAVCIFSFQLFTLTQPTSLNYVMNVRACAVCHKVNKKRGSSVQEAMIGYRACSLKECNIFWALWSFNRWSLGSFVHKNFCFTPVVLLVLYHRGHPHTWKQR